MVDQFDNALRRPISEARLQSYGKPGDATATRLLNYFWNIELAQAFYPLLQAFEVSFRNSIHETLSHVQQRDRWFDDESFLPEDQLNKIREAKESIAGRGKPDTTGRIVAQLTFGFWTSMLNRPFEETLWHTGSPIVLLSAFPHLPKHRRTRKTVYGRAQLANTLRNRIFHYEPIWNRPNLASEHANVVEALGWVSPEMCRAISFYDRFDDVFDRGSDYQHEGLWKHLNLHNR